MSLVFIRLGAPEPIVAAAVATRLDPFYPATTASTPEAAERDALNRDLCDLLVFLRSQTVLAKTIALLKEPPLGKPTAAATNLAELAARNTNVWRCNPGDGDESARHSGNRLRLFAPQSARRLDRRSARASTSAGCATNTKNKVAAAFRSSWTTSNKRPTKTPPTPIDLRSTPPACTSHTSRKNFRLPLGPGQEYTVDALVALSSAQPAGRNFVAGKRAFAAARCVVCHRFESDGGATGPDLTQAAGRFNLRDLSESIVDPSKVVSDQYRATVIQTESGRQLIGRVIGENNDSITLLTDPEDSTKWVQLPKNRNRIAHPVANLADAQESVEHAEPGRSAQPVGLRPLARQSARSDVREVKNMEFTVASRTLAGWLPLCWLAVLAPQSPGAMTTADPKARDRP